MPDRCRSHAPMWALITGAILLLSATGAIAEINPMTPLPDDGDRAISDIGTACGLIETDWTDPDWMMVTSDRILRSRDCVAECADCPECWYDQPFQPCYTENRYWKLAENSGTAFAFPLSALGIGTFDGLYIRRNFKYQIYFGTDPHNPCGPERTGPAYISLDFWRDVSVACEGFEPGTIFLTGGPGGLANYSLRLGGVTTIVEVDLKKDENRRGHHTDRFSTDLVLRRGTPFDMLVRLGREYGAGCHDLYLEAAHRFDGHETIIPIPPVTEAPDLGSWGARVIGVRTNQDETRSVDLRVFIPFNAPVGTWDFKVLVRNVGATTPSDEVRFEEETFILFNPWQPEDQVYMSGDSERDEYVLHNNGDMWRGSAEENSPLGWRFAQFDRNTLQVAMDLLEGLSASARSTPALVARYLSKMTNVQDDHGVVIGNWSGAYAGGRSPSYWSGSDQILERYSSSGSVAYGQCWVFGGVLTSLLRCVGIPARPLTNFDSGHDGDHPMNKVVDLYFDEEGNYLGGDSIWNYHVWVDAWLQGWHAVDGTPQETSAGAYQLGPASLTAIRGNMGGDYDVDFVHAEVDAPVKYWLRPTIGSDRLIRTDLAIVGQNITTRALGGGRSDITSSYKVPEAPPPLVVLAAATEVSLSGAGMVPLGSNIVWQLTCHNVGIETATVQVNLSACALAGDGSELMQLREVQSSRIVEPGDTETVDLTLTLSDYLPWTGATRTFQVAAAAFVGDIADPFLQIARTSVTINDPDLSYVGPLPLGEGGAGGLVAEWVNPLPIDLTNAWASFAVSRGLSVGDNGEVLVSLGTIASGGTVYLQQPFTARAGGEQYASLVLGADQVSDLRAGLAISVYADCNGNGREDQEDIAFGISADCNGNLVPDDCEADCNGNGIPDVCEVRDDPSLDCNGNGVPDTCDLAASTSPDANGNGLPDECETDCNGNGVPDDLDIALGTSFDHNRNHVPDECDFDCNENDISDEIDIALGSSLDINQNGVPDECEVRTDTTPPQIMVTLNRYALWPPNHLLMDIVAVVDVEDDQDRYPEFVLTSITSNERDADLSTEDVPGDIEGAAFGAPDLEFRLRSERDGSGSGRTYTIVYTARDEAGNTAEWNETVRVPHDQGGAAVGANGFSDSGKELLPGTGRFSIAVLGSPDEAAALGAPVVAVKDIVVERARVGNGAGVTAPLAAAYRDVDDDGVTDLVLTFDAAPTLDIIAATGDRDGTLGLHYSTAAGDQLLVMDIFSLGPPLKLEEPTPVEDVPGRDFGLHVYPNPFNPSTLISFDLPRDADVLVEIYSVTGSRVAQLWQGHKRAGRSELRWDGLDMQGRRLPSGSYFLRLSAGGLQETEKITLLR